MNKNLLNRRPHGLIVFDEENGFRILMITSHYERPGTKVCVVGSDSDDCDPSKLKNRFAERLRAREVDFIIHAFMQAG